MLAEHSNNDIERKCFIIMTTKKVGLDGGHAGFNVTPGKRTPDNEYEWNFNNAVLLACKKKLEAHDVTVVRTDDPTGKTDVPLATRVQRANAAKVHAFVSIHHNANTGQWGQWTGTETFTMLGAQPGSDLLAEYVQEGLVKAYGLRDRGLKKEAFYVIRYTNMPAILIEGGYMDSTIDIKKLRDNAVLKAAGEQIASGLLEFLGIKEQTAVVKPPVTATPTAGWFRVRKSWADADSQIGAFKDKNTAIDLVKERLANKETGYEVYDDKGKQVYPVIVTKPSAAKKKTGTVTAVELNVRSGASASGKVIATLKKGNVVEILETKNGWHRIQAKKPTYGWVSSDYLKNNVVSNCQELNIRAGVGTSNSIIGKFKAGKKVKVVATKNGWSKVVITHSDFGWISGTYVK